MNEFALVSASIALISFGVSIFLAWVLFVTPSNYYTNLLLSISLLIGSSVFILRLLVILESRLAIYAPLFVFPLSFQIGPILFFYTRAILFRKSASRKEVFTYLIPSIFTFFLFVSLLYFSEEFKDLSSIIHQKKVVGNFTAILFSCATIYISYFCVLSIRYVFLYQRELENEYSQNEKGRLVWLKAYIGINILNVLIYFGLIILFFTGTLRIPPITPLEGFINLAMIYLILYYLIRKPELISLQYLEEIQDSLPNDLKNIQKEIKYSKQSLSEEERKQILTQLQKEMSSHKVFLEEGISLKSLADRMSIPAHHISMTINAELGQNFFQWINSYRISEACSLLLQPDAKNKNVLNVGLEAGFQSKAVFNKTFKNATGMTPTQYRMKNLR